jgi:hypothetical protein
MDVVDRKRDIFSVDVESVGIKSRVDIEFETRGLKRTTDSLNRWDCTVLILSL